MDLNGGYLHAKDLNLTVNGTERFEISAKRRSFFFPSSGITNQFLIYVSERVSCGIQGANRKFGPRKI